MDRTQANIRRLTEKHLARYNGMLEAAKEGKLYQGTEVRTEETEQLLSTWKRVQDKNYIFEQLSKEDQNEIIDAILEGE